ncbi:MAG: family 20 glycosylhydrolase [Maribacter litoralis]|uniref:beta-N-acetylhexosaminidase n=1 Tax=Maribacter litoralis TaxID=2059726 RepID=UPI00329851F6
MKKFFKILSVIVVLLIIGAAIAWFGYLKPEPPAISDEDRAKITMMPLPTELELGDENFEIAIDFGFSIKGVNNEKITKGLDRFFVQLAELTQMPLQKQEGIDLEINSTNATEKYPSKDDDESYALKISNKEIVLSAATDTGVLYGLESLLQLAKIENGKWVFPELELKDNPRYPWRGLMIDVARHWIDKETILRNIDAMSAVKMNVLHLHLTEYQSFRIESKKFPKLHQLGSQGKYFSQDDIKEIIAYASDRGIRVIPEFDVPGHTTAWFVGHPELATAPGPYELDSIFGILDPVMDPTREEVYDFLDEFIGEMATLFPDEYLHIGGDEVKAKQWNESEHIQKFMKDNDIEDAHELQAYFNIRLQKILAKHGKQMMGWDEIIHPDLPKDGIAVQSWRNQKSLWEAVRSGNNAILSAGYYLDHKRPASFHYDIDPTVIQGGVTIEVDSTNWKAWKTKIYVQENEIDGFLYIFGEGTDNVRGIMDMMGGTSDFTNVKVDSENYSFINNTSFGDIDVNLKTEGDSISGEMMLSIISIDLKGKQIGGSKMEGGTKLPKFEKIKPLTPAEEANILGGEACMWSEVVDNRNIDSRIWPRTAVIAEKLWSPKDLTKNEDDMYRRLMVIDKQLDEIGVQHNKSSEILINEMVPENYIEPLRNLVNVLEEVKMYNRMAMYGGELSVNTPLNKIVDAAKPESFLAYKFNKDVDLFLETGDPLIKERLQDQLQIWSENHQKLAPAFGLPEKFIENNPMTIDIFEQATIIRLKEVESHSSNLSNLAELALLSLEGKAISSPDSLMLKSREEHAGTLLPIVDAIEKLIGKK